MDYNMGINAEGVKEESMIFYDVKKDPFHIYGLYDYKNQDSFKRIPDEVAKCSADVKFLYRNTSGARARFSTNSKKIAIKVSLEMFDSTSHRSQMTLCGTSGFDMYIYENGRYVYYMSFLPPYDMTDGYEKIIEFEDNSQKDIMINFPLGCNVISLFIGLDNQANLNSGREYLGIKPIVYYGSSITQGTCASRPGNSYPAIISRELDVDYLNLGFAGSARGEEEIARYIAGLDISAFVYDYDYNAPTVSYLQSTHKRFFEIIRKSQAKLPIIMLSRPSFDNNIKESKERRNVILKTYQDAISLGDENVYFIDGETIFGDRYRDCCLCDNIHPNDYGYVCMADRIGFVLKRIFRHNID